LARIVGQTDERGLRALLPQYLDAWAVELDDHEDHAVRETARRDAPHVLRTLVARDQQDVVGVTAAGQRLGAGVGVVAELGHGALHTAPGRVGQ
jgi:hypothetical protein